MVQSGKEDTWISLSERDRIYHKDLLKDVLDIANVEKVWIESRIKKDYEDIIFFLRRKVNKNKILKIKGKYKYVSKIKFLENPKRIIIRSTHHGINPFVILLQENMKKLLKNGNI